MKVIASRDHYAAHLAPVAALVEDVEGVLVASYGDMVTARRTSDRIVLMQHGAGQSYSDRHPGYPGGDDNEAVGLFLVPGPHPAKRWRERYPDTPVVEVGCPKLDTLPAREPGKLTVAITFHWRTGSVPEARTAFPFFASALPELRDSFNLIGTSHPRARGIRRTYDRLGIEYVPDFEDVCRWADVLIGDNTSAIFEFAATGRAVVLMDAPDYRRDVDHGLRFWDAAMVGPRVAEPAALIGGVELAAMVGPRWGQLREEALAKVYTYRTGAAQRAADAIREWAA